MVVAGLAATLLLGVLLLFLLGLHHRGAEWGSTLIHSLEGLNRLLCRRYHRLQGELTPIPTHGAAVVICNHLSGLDPFLLLAAASRPLRFLMAREEYERWGLQWLFRAVGCIPVDRGSNPERAYRAAIRALEEGEIVALFPQGAITLEQQPSRLKAGAWRLAQRQGVPMVVVRLSGVAGVGEVTAALWRRSRVKLHAERLDLATLDQAAWQAEVNRFWFHSDGELPP